MSDQFVDGSKHLDRCNLVPKSDFKNIIDNMVTKLIELFRISCGPTARYAMVMTPDNSGNGSIDPTNTLKNHLHVFTKDGKYILDYLDYANPIQIHLKHMFNYISTQVEHRCGDGTTTSIIFTAILISELIQRSDAFKHLTTDEVTNVFKSILDELKVDLQKQSITFNEFKEHFKLSESDTLKYVTLMQSFTCSNRNVDISKGVAEAMSYTSSECVEDLTQYLPNFEFPETVKVEVSDAQFVIEHPMFANIELLNCDYGRSYKRDGVTVLNITEGLRNDSQTSRYLNMFLNSVYPNEKHLFDEDGNTRDLPTVAIPEDIINKPLCVLVPSVTAEIVQSIRLLNDQAKQNNTYFEVFFIIAKGAQSKLNNTNYQAFTWCGACDKPMLLEENHRRVWNDSLVKNVRVEFEHFKFKVFDIFKASKKTNAHPGIYKPKKYPYFTEYRNVLLKEREFLKTSHLKTPTDLKACREALSDLQHVNKIRIYGGGRTHDQLAIRHVLEDCMKASISTVQSGMTFSAPLRAFTIMVRKLDSLRLEDTVEREIMTSIIIAFDKLIEIIYGKSIEWKSVNTYLKKLTKKFEEDKFLFADRMDSSLNIGDAKTYTTLDSSYIKKLQHLTADTFIPPVQSVPQFEELFDRSRELLFKMALVETIVIPRTIWENVNGSSRS